MSFLLSIYVINKVHLRTRFFNAQHGNNMERGTLLIVFFWSVLYSDTILNIHLHLRGIRFKILKIRRVWPLSPINMVNILPLNLVHHSASLYFCFRLFSKISWRLCCCSYSPNICFLRKASEIKDMLQCSWRLKTATYIIMHVVPSKHFSRILL